MDERPEFNNKANKAAAEGSINGVSNAAFALSTASSSISIWAAMIGFSGADFFGWASLLFAAIAVAICSAIDFFGVKRAGKYFLTEVIAMACGAFAKFTILRFISLVVWALVFFTFFASSFITSYNGSEIIRTAFAPKSNAEDISVIAAKRDASESDISARYEAKRASIEAQRKQELETVGAAQTRKLARKGNFEAIDELAKLKKPVNAKFDKRIAAIDKEELEAKKDFGQRQKALEEEQLKSLKAEADGLQARANAISIIVLAFGVVPLLIGGALTVVQALSEVSEKAEKAEAERRAEEARRANQGAPQRQAYNSNSNWNGSNSSYGNFHNG